jgi:hypothetical protein
MPGEASREHIPIHLVVLYQKYLRHALSSFLVHDRPAVGIVGPTGRRIESTISRSVSTSRARS